MNDELKYHYLSMIPLFETLAEADRRDLFRLLKLRQARKGEQLHFGQGEYSKVFFVFKGKVKLMESDRQENEMVKEILSEGEIFGDLALQGEPDQEEWAEVLTPNSWLGQMLASDLKAFMQNHPKIALQFAMHVSQKLRVLEDRHADLVFRDARYRLIRFIKDWARRDGSRQGDKIILHNYLTHSDIAGFISTSRQSVNVLLNELRDAGFIFYDRKRIELNNPQHWN